MSTELSEEWQTVNAFAQERKGRIGGSDIAVIMGLSPYKSPVDLWQEKTGLVRARDISDLPHVRRGIEAEPVARALLEARLRVKYTTPQLRDSKYACMGVSLDGLCAGHVLEIKTMGLEKHLAVARGVVPDYYVTQVQWGMMIADKRRGVLASYRPEDASLYWSWLRRDERLIRDMRAYALRFWRCVERRRKPVDRVYRGSI